MASILVLAIILLSAPEASIRAVNGSEAGNSPETAAIRSMPMAGATKIYNNEHSRVVEYCPDSTCETFVAPINSTERAFYVSALAYYLFHSKYTYLKAWRLNHDLTNLVASERNTNYLCDRKKGINQAKCNLKAFIVDNGANVLFTRYDEGERIDLTITRDVLSEISESAQ